MKKLKFEPSNFMGNKEYSGLCHDLNSNTKIAARMAQELFDKWFKDNIENAPTVKSESLDDWHGAFSDVDYKPKYKAKIVCEERI